MSKSGLKLVCNVNIVHRNLKSENSQDFAQKPQQNCTFINSASWISAEYLYMHKNPKTWVPPHAHNMFEQHNHWACALIYFSRRTLAQMHMRMAESWCLCQGHILKDRQHGTTACPAFWVMGTNKVKKCRMRKTYFVLGRLELPRQDQNLLY